MQKLALLGVCAFDIQNLSGSDLTPIQNCVNNEDMSLSEDDIFATLFEKSRIENKKIFLIADGVEFLKNIIMIKE